MVVGILLLSALIATNIHLYRSKKILWKALHDPQQIVERFHTLSYMSPSTWLLNRWMGIKTQQNPEDVWITQEIISEVKPDLIIETGTYYGGSALLWATILDNVNPSGRVVTIDIEDSTADVRKIGLFQRKVDFLLGSSTAPEIVAKVAKMAQGKKVMALFDSDHRKQHVLDEMKCYSPLITVGSYMIVQDGNINGHPVLPECGPGPYEAIEDFLKINRNFESDKSRERLLFTMHPNGYLKRTTR
jgi:cephalosporin hydroxylase